MTTPCKSCKTKTRKMKMSEQSQSLAGVNVMLMGPPGTGKTHSIGTLVDTGIEVFYLALENGIESLKGYWLDRGKEIPPNLRWHIVDPPKAGFADMLAMAQKVNTLSSDALAKITDTSKSKHDQWVKMLTVMSNFLDQRTGQSFGSVDSWGPNKCLVIDGLSGLNRYSMANAIGGKLLKSQADWGLAQTQVENFLTMVCDGCKCWFVLLGHIERETDQVLGGVKLSPSTLGKALVPKIPALFSDVVLSVKQGDKWTWDTANTMADLKIRNLPIAAGLNPDFKQIMEKWKSRGGVL